MEAASEPSVNAELQYIGSRPSFYLVDDFNGKRWMDVRMAKCETIVAWMNRLTKTIDELLADGTLRT
jgi:hypothetical protein